MLGYEQELVDLEGAAGGDISVPASVVTAVHELCARPDTDWDLPMARPELTQAKAKGAVMVCPDAPHIAELTRVANGVPRPPKAELLNENSVVGKDVEPGTYQAQVPQGANGVNSCYWERTNPQGDTIENDFINFAPEGPIVTLYEGEGFVSSGCPTWKKIG